MTTGKLKLLLVAATFLITFSVHAQVITIKPATGTSTTVISNGHVVNTPVMSNAPVATKPLQYSKVVVAKPKKHK